MRLFAPGQAVVAHLRREQAPGRFGGTQEPEPSRLIECVDPGELVSVPIDERGERVEADRGRRRWSGVEQRALDLARRRGWAHEPATPRRSA